MSFSVVFTPDGPIAPTYADILAYFKQQMRSIYGSDIYLDADSQDGQMIAIFAAAVKSQNDALIAAYQSFSPSTAQGVGLSNVVKINGIRRLVPTNSQVIQRVTGVVGTEILNGLVSDPNTPSIQWALPATVVIPDAGFIDVTATATTEGATAAGANTLTRIVTPTRNWQSTNNAAAATPGSPVESDATLRRRQSQSTSIPALSVLGAIQGAIENLTGVGRTVVYENDTGAPDSNGIPAHSISAVVQGGDIDDIANTIALYKTPGTGTYGSTAVTVIDLSGIANVIRFYELALIDIGVLVDLDAETGYVSTTGDLIIAALVEYFNSLTIGQDSQLNKLWSPVNLTGDSATLSSGFTQAQLDVLSNTYNPTAIYQARVDNMILTAPTAAGDNDFALTDVANYDVGKSVAVVLDDGSFLKTVITGIAALVVTTLANVPGGRTAETGALMYVAGDVAVLFNEAAEGDDANMLVDAS